MVAISKAQLDEQARRAWLMGMQQWDAVMQMAKTCPHVRGFTYIGPDSITIAISEKCPWLKFRERLQKEVFNAVNPV